MNSPWVGIIALVIVYAVPLCMAMYQGRNVPDE